MTRAPTGIEIRHTRACPSRTGGKCPDSAARGCCKPTFQAHIWSAREQRRIRKTFATLSAAKQWRSDAVVALRRGELAAPSKLTLEQAGNEWLEKAKRGDVVARHRQPYKPSTLRGYEHDLETYIYPDLDGLRLSEIRRRDVQALVDRLIAKRLSGSKVRNVVVVMQAIYRHAKRRDLITIDPTDELELPEPGGRRERAATPEEALQLIDALPEEEQALWGTAFLAGLRRGELRALRAEDIDEKVTTIHVRRGWDDVEGEIAPKSRKGERRVPIAKALRLILLEHLTRTGRRGEDLVFGRTRSEPFTPTHVRKCAREAWATAELPPIGLHEARHTYVTLMHAAGRSLEEIGDFVGHSSTYMTDRYRHLLDGARAEAADALDAYLTRATSAATDGRKHG